jgi:hypothetical protein
MATTVLDLLASAILAFLFRTPSMAELNVVRLPDHGVGRFNLGEVEMEVTVRGSVQRGEARRTRTPVGGVTDCPPTPLAFPNLNATK